MATICSDAFTAGSNENLRDHVPSPTGTSWTDSAAGDLVVLSASDNLSASGTAIEIARENTDVGDDDMDVSADCTNNSAVADRRVGVTGRNISSALTTYYAAYLIGDGSTVDVNLDKVVAGAVTNLGSYGLNGATGTTFNIKLKLRTDSQEVLIDGVSRISTADTAITGNNYAGIYMQKGAPRLDNFLVESAGVSAAITGTITSSATEADIVTGGKTTIITLTGDTWIAAGALSFDLQRDEIIAGVDSAQSEANGWDLVPKATQSLGGVVRTSDTVVTITWDAFPTYDITATETITVTVPATAVVLGGAITASPTFTVTATGAASTVKPFTMLGVG